jgi:hypothetical protein
MSSLQMMNYTEHSCLIENRVVSACDAFSVAGCLNDGRERIELEA